MDHRSTRREVLGLFGAAALAALPVRVIAADAAKLELNDPTAKALGFVENAAKLDAKAEPTFKPGSHCAGCALYAKATEKAGYAGCGAFGGKLVPAAGWCRAYAAG